MIKLDSCQGHKDGSTYTNQSSVIQHINKRKDKTHSALGTPVGRAGCEASARGALWASETRLNTKEKKKAISELWLFSRLLFFSVEHTGFGAKQGSRWFSCAAQKESRCRPASPTLKALQLCGWQGLGALAGRQAWASEVGELSSETTRDLLAPCNINRWELSQRSPSQR